MTSRTIIVSVLAVAAAAIVPGRAAAQPKDFSHVMHLELGPECQTCHAQEGRGAPRLNTEACKDCHEDGAPAWRLPAGDTPRLPRFLAFPHAAHGKKMDCKTCHAATVEDKPQPGGVFLVPKQCFTCHTERKAKVPISGCKACHGRNMRAVEPGSHDGGWRQEHQFEGRWQVFASHGKECRLCHGQSACTSCHDRMTPRSHTGLFRVRTHGQAAEWDRDRCRTCHESGTCVRCHVTTEPLNHRTTNWIAVHGLVAGTTSNDTCVRACHSMVLPCRTCHTR